jgi:hypothetical protein
MLYLQSGGILGTSGQDHAALAGRNVLGDVEAEAPEVAERSRGVPVVARLDGVSAVFDDDQLVTRRQIPDGRDITRPAGEVHGDDRAGPRRDGGLDGRGVDVHGARIDIGEKRCGAGMDDCVGGRAERERRRDDLVTRLQSGDEDAQVQRRRAGAYGDGVRGTLVGGEVLFQLRDLGAGAEPAAAQTVDDLVDLVLADGGGAEDQKVGDVGGSNHAGTRSDADRSSAATDSRA